MKKIDDSKFALPYKNILYIIIGFAVMVLGYVLMAGGGSDDPNVFNMEMFSFRRTVLAPIVILAGMVEIIWAIMYIGKSKKEDK
ncbi:MAG: DUF3098 domain-containing protein [Bacteroidales bacterium]|jgi:hypothetical protein|nr:DUF3098 domain-containing protein [Bacteroidales bacterium]MBQ1929866.1 DUF3098 domain-containing protein [Bacteroidales bacterium]MBQ5593771.1 DUF3098 domain-containing protein [Bacteroidales bacterium]MBQ5783888.1 DUF3098 domain-containing protein [Bacteroidales bacterium]